MDSNPCAELLHEGTDNLYAALALIAILDGNGEAAEEWMRRIPRGRRGRVFRATDDLTMLISRLGRK